MPAIWFEDAASASWIETWFAASDSRAVETAERFPLSWSTVAFTDAIDWFSPAFMRAEVSLSPCMT